MMELQHRRSDGSFTALLNGLPYHVVEGDPLFATVDASDIAALPLEPVPEPSPPAPRVFSKRKLFLALTDAEYAIFEAIEAQQPARDRRAFAEATELNEGDDDWPQFLGLMHAAYGEERMAAILDAAAL
jgi:hypothetical protein